ncbi:MAG TPA: hydantoinase/oxoprolinase family protein, partial [Methylophilaceae bacterium]|nr:hydantoinase/oxoprolinase family protein [Methylophilaceae bacterium]
GWDIGGANLKAVLLGEQGELLYARQLACPLWLGLDQLTESITSMLKLLGCAACSVNHAVTMTGELVDLFNNRQEGVVQIAQCASKHLGQDILFYQMSDHRQRKKFVSIDQVSSASSGIASANWHASASLVAKKQPFSLLVDVGSTTTDIISIINGLVISSNWTDAQRLQQDTLLYTGVVRTPVMAIARKIEVDGKTSNVAAEYFSTMADVFRLTGELNNYSDIEPTADGAAKTIDASAKRLARMVGYDFEEKPLEVWLALAHAFRNKQLSQIACAMEKNLSSGMMIVGTGAGQFLVKEAASTLNIPYANLATLFDLELAQEVDICFPAFAVAKLALEC